MTQYDLTMSDERIKQYNEEVSARNTDIATKGAVVVSFVAYVTLALFEVVSVPAVICAFYLIASVFTAFFAEKSFGVRMKHNCELVCIMLLTCTIPFQWFFTGGFDGVSSIWFLFTAIYAMFGLSGKTRNVVLCIIVAILIATVALTFSFPQLVQPMEEHQRRVLTLSSMAAIGWYVLYVGLGQKIISDEAAVNLAMLQDDLTAQNQELIAVNDELIDMTEQLKIANDTQRHFTASMNHELRAPLNGVEGCLQMLLMSGTLGEENTEIVRNALTSSNIINQTVNDLLDFAKLEEGKFDIVKTRFDLRDVLDNVTTIFNPMALAKGLEFQIRIPKNSRVSMVADGVRIQQIMTNLLSNGIKYTREGSVVMTISTTSCNLEFDVVDTGQGMTKEEIEVLFDPFTRFNMKENVKIQGTGLGMNVVSNLIREMRGQIDVESTVNVGTKFHISIPIMYYDSDITFCSPRVQEEKTDAEEFDMSHLRILSVDDMQINRTVIRGLLKPTKAEVIDVGSGRKAVEYCRREKYDVILLDHMMPEMDGIETMLTIHESGLNINTPIIMLTGNTGKEYTDLYAQKGAAGYLEKPVKYENLVATIKNCIQA